MIFELKLHASRKDAIAAFESLRAMTATMNYDLAVFLNIDSTAPYREMIPPELGARFIALSVILKDGQVVVTE